MLIDDWINFDTFKIIGIIYFIVEILIIVVLAIFELKIALNHNELKNK